MSLTACTSQPQLGQLVQSAHTELKNAGFEAAEATPTQLIKAWVRQNSSASRPTTPWHVYIEGDGAAWQSQGRPSVNPTPRDPVALKLAIEDRSARVIYLARPCQFFTTVPKECHFSDWTTERYSSQQTERMREALSALIGEEAVILIGFSGGANLAMQIAEHQPVRGIVSVAGNLDDHLFSRYHRLPQPDTTPLRPTDLPIWSVSGANDPIIPPRLADTMLKQVSGKELCRHHETINEANHTGPWRLDWYAISIFQEHCLSSPPQGKTTY
ncbi:alpha/beta fold hydrolase [Billgrantia sp. LNSP4103-1]|uniref:alpha/beta fold hydrolase n=1 Tax=Billgrantia sp. LNSP4103-1 TaxID=3410266 RepID=UPI00403F7221